MEFLKTFSTCCPRVIYLSISDIGIKLCNYNIVILFNLYLLSSHLYENNPIVCVEGVTGVMNEIGPYCISYFQGLETAMERINPLNQICCTIIYYIHRYTWLLDGWTKYFLPALSLGLPPSFLPIAPSLSRQPAGTGFSSQLNRLH